MIPRLSQEKYKMSPEHPSTPESKEVLKTEGNMAKGHWNLEGFPLAKYRIPEHQNEKWQECHLK